jgi:glucarate dehydratase
VTTITGVRVTPIAFRDPPLLNAAGIHEPYALRSIIEVEAGELLGLGESYGDAPVLAALTAIAPALVGLEIHDLNGLERVIREELAKLPAAKAGAELAPGSQPSRLLANCFSAFEVALLDLQAKSAGLPLHALLGGAVRREVPFSAYLFFKYARHIEPEEAPDAWGEAVTPEQIVAQAKRMIDMYGFGSIKLKAGTLPPRSRSPASRPCPRPSPACPCASTPMAPGRCRRRWTPPRSWAR